MLVMICLEILQSKISKQIITSIHPPFSAAKLPFTKNAKGSKRYALNPFLT
jgi:hypothetical protein